MNAPPIPAIKEYLILFAHMVSKASLAAGQKLLPVKAISNHSSLYTWMYAFRFKNLINLSKHAIKQDRQLRTHFVILLLLPPAAYICNLTQN